MARRLDRYAGRSLRIEAHKIISRRDEVYERPEFSPEQRNALLQLSRTELLEIFKHADARTRPVGYPGTSIGDMIVAKGQPIEYLIDAVQAGRRVEKLISAHQKRCRCLPTDVLIDDKLNLPK
jgi:hypothetical protein